MGRRTGKDSLTGRPAAAAAQRALAMERGANGVCTSARPSPVSPPLRGYYTTKKGAPTAGAPFFGGK
ncbi:hypothetical protein HMPREF0262_00516 [Clostridium sp. ATCC 29733]|nr:hypothetical protein HMPREF0262_00516 [Clostridium sp. ATCC 29733]